MEYIGLAGRNGSLDARRRSRTAPRTSRSTPEDEAFKKRVRKEFIDARDRAIRNGFSMEEFVAKLGVTRAAFHKYITCKAIPSLRVLSKARRYWGVKLSYAELGDGFLRTKSEDLRQTKFQFSIGGISKDQIEVRKFSPRGESSVELVITIDFAKGA